MVLIGAGSVVFTKTILLDLIADAGREWRLSLVDVSEDALEVAYRLCSKINAGSGGRVSIERTAERRDVLKGADCVVATIGVGGRHSWEQDVVIPRKYGVFQPVGDTAMPGGISRAMRMIPAMLDITRDVMELCPDAYYFNYSNPMSTICRAMRKATGSKMIGLCHGVYDSMNEISAFLGVPADECTAFYAGINHLTYMYDFRYKGADMWPAAREKLAAVKAAGFDYADLSVPTPNPSPLPTRFCWSIFDEVGAYPAPGDYHVTEFYPERFPGGKIYNGTLGVDALTHFEDYIVYGDADFEQMRRWGNMSGPLPAEAYHTHKEKLIDMIDSIERDSRFIFPVNLPNNGAVKNLPNDAILEIPAAATALGFCPLVQPRVSDVIAGLVAKQLTCIEVTVEAALAGDRKLFAEAILMGGYITDRNAVDRMVNELLAAQRQYLPQF